MCGWNRHIGNVSPVILNLDPASTLLIQRAYVTDKSQKHVTEIALAISPMPARAKKLPNRA